MLIFDCKLFTIHVFTLKEFVTFLQFFTPYNAVVRFYSFYRILTNNNDPIICKLFDYNKENLYVKLINLTDTLCLSNVLNVVLFIKKDLKSEQSDTLNSRTEYKKI